MDFNPPRVYIAAQMISYIVLHSCRSSPVYDLNLQLRVLSGDRYEAKYTFVPGHELNHIQAGSAFNLNWAKD